MPVNQEAYANIKTELSSAGISLVAVSKTKPVSDISELYELGQRDFGENYVQELVEKEAQLPKDIRWHFIGHLQSNKVKYIATFVHLIHGVDSLKLLKEIDKQGKKSGRKISCLLQVHIAREETKFGMDANELAEAIEAAKSLEHVSIAGLMGMASFSSQQELVQAEFHFLNSLFQTYPGLQYLSMGMSGDYQLAIREGSNMVRIGSLLFGSR